MKKCNMKLYILYKCYVVYYDEFYIFRLLIVYVGCK